MADNKRREQTQIEKDYEKLPECLYDPLKVWTCHHHMFPPSPEKCFSCLKRSFSDAVSCDDGAEAMKAYLATIQYFEGKNHAET